jgi:GT2 family glycosyltransferase
VNFSELFVFSDLDSEQLLKVALDCFSAGDFMQAESLVTQSIQGFQEGSSVAYAYALRGSIYEAQGLFEYAAKDLHQALSSYPFQSLFLQKLSNLAKSNSFQIRIILTQAVNEWLSVRPQDWRLPAILESLKSINISVFGVVEITPEGDLNGWIISPANAASNFSVLLEIDSHVISHSCQLPSPELLNVGIGNGKNAFHIKLQSSFENCRLGIAGHGSLWGSPIRGTLHFSDVTKMSNFTSNTEAQPLETVDVLIPVYKGLDDTIRCLNSLYATKYSNKTVMRIIVINDVSPDSKLTETLRTHSKQGLIQLIERPFNVGFVGTINTGLSVESNNDVLLLNADTCVAGNWLDRLRNAANSSADIGTVTPITNNGELLSYPFPMQSNEMPSNEQAMLLDDLFSKLGSEIPHVIPTGVGFCLYIKREVLKQLGGLHEHLIYRGYGEETEFCLRVVSAGWKNVVASNVYIAHKGSVSFGQEKAKLAKRNNAQIHARFPNHNDEYNLFLRQNPFLPLYRQIQRTWLRIQLLPHTVFLHLIHASETLKNNDGISLRLELHEESIPTVLRLVIDGIAGLVRIDYDFPTQSDELLEDLKSLKLSGFQQHGISRWSPDFLDNLKSCI